MVDSSPCSVRYASLAARSVGIWTRTTWWAGDDAGHDVISARWTVDIGVDDGRLDF